MMMMMVMMKMTLLDVVGEGMADAGELSHLQLHTALVHCF